MGLHTAMGAASDSSVKRASCGAGGPASDVCGAFQFGRSAFALVPSAPLNPRRSRGALVKALDDSGVEDWESEV